MTDYISRQAAIEAVRLVYKSYLPEDSEPWIIEQLHELPAADVVEVVRCKDCRYCRTEYGRGKWYGSCLYWNTHSVMDNDYCSRFERLDK